LGAGWQVAFWTAKNQPKVFNKPKQFHRTGARLIGSRRDGTQPFIGSMALFWLDSFQNVRRLLPPMKGEHEAIL
jgi:hypothetical protein